MLDGKYRASFLVGRGDLLNGSVVGKIPDDDVLGVLALLKSIGDADRDLTAEIGNRIVTLGHGKVVDLTVAETLRGGRIQIKLIRSLHVYRQGNVLTTKAILGGLVGSNDRALQLDGANVADVQSRATLGICNLSGFAKLTGVYGGRAA